jgi:heat shock protein HslJ
MRTKHTGQAPTRRAFPGPTLGVAGAAVLASAVLALAGCASQGGNEVAAPVGDELDGSWQLTAGTDASGTFDLGDAAITLDVDGTRASGNSGCNSYTGDFGGTADGVAFGPFASTQMYCEPDSLMKLEARYLKALETVDTAAIDDDTLTLSLDDDVLQLIYTEVEAPDDSELVGPTWTLETITTADAASSVQGDATLVFGEDGTFRGSAGCRGFGGDYLAADDDEIRISQLEIDHSNCPAEIGDQETQVFDVIGEGFRAQIEGDVLTVSRTGSDSTLLYRAGDPR